MTEVPELSFRVPDIGDQSVLNATIVCVEDGSTVMVFKDRKELVLEPSFLM